MNHDFLLVSFSQWQLGTLVTMGHVLSYLWKWFPDSKTRVQ